MALICVVARLANKHELFAAPRRLASETIAPETRLMWDLFRGSLRSGVCDSRFPWRLERGRGFQLLDGLGDLGALVGGKAGDGAREIGIGDRVGGTRRHRQQPTSELVHALRAAFEVPDPVLDEEVDGLIESRL